jgi:hypothetical protein
VANGNNMVCQHQLLQTPWEVQGCQFVSYFLMLPLQHFDVILGFDWLEQFSLMKIHWGQKWMSIPYQSTTVVLQGILTQLNEGTLVQVIQWLIWDWIRMIKDPKMRLCLLRFRSCCGLTLIFLLLKYVFHPLEFITTLFHRSLELGQCLSDLTGILML